MRKIVGEKVRFSWKYWFVCTGAYQYYPTNFTAQANQIFTVLSGGIWSVAGRPRRAFYAE
jgi:hypothetical protein